MRKFEYTVLDVPAKGFWVGKIDYKALTVKLNELGKQGWEVVSTVDTTLYQSATRSVIVILKREVIY